MTAMDAQTAERRVKALQKAFLVGMEEHPVLFALSPDDFNDIRKRVFKGTFKAYRFGVIGLEKTETSLWDDFVGWLADSDAIEALPEQLRADLLDMCFRCALDCFRTGAMVAGGEAKA